MLSGAHYVKLVFSEFLKWPRFLQTTPKYMAVPLPSSPGSVRCLSSTSVSLLTPSREMCIPCSWASLVWWFEWDVSSFTGIWLLGSQLDPSMGRFRRSGLDRENILLGGLLQGFKKAFLVCPHLPLLLLVAEDVSPSSQLPAPTKCLPPLVIPFSSDGPSGVIKPQVTASIGHGVSHSNRKIAKAGREQSSEKSESFS